MKNTVKYKCLLVKEQGFRYEQKIDGAETAWQVLKKIELASNAEETAVILCLDGKGNIVGIHEVSRGELGSTVISPREIFKRAVLNNAFAIILAHNHPSGDPTPSMEDIKTTKRLLEAGELMGIPLIDHIIVVDGGYNSLRMQGLLETERKEGEEND